MQMHCRKLFAVDLSPEQKITSIQFNKYNWVPTVWCVKYKNICIYFKSCSFCPCEGQSLEEMNMW